MRFYSLVAPIAVLALCAPATASAASWSTATATAVSAGVTSKSTFEIQAYVTLPQQCYSARIRTLDVTSQLHRSFIVEQMPSSSPCTGKTYNCAVMASYRLPIQQPFEVETKGKNWETHLSMHSPAPMTPECRKG